MAGLRLGLDTYRNKNGCGALKDDIKLSLERAARLDAASLMNRRSDFRFEDSVSGFRLRQYCTTNERNTNWDSNCTCN